MRMVARHHRIVSGCLALVLSLCALAACEKEPTPLPFLTPTPPPTPTPTVKQVLHEQLYTISLNGALLATERIDVGEADGQILVASELVRVTTPREVERRTLVLTDALNPLRYDLERTFLGVRSIWVAERTGDGMNCLGNNQNWYAPVLVGRVMPTPHVILESAPSALPFAILSLQYAALGQDSLSRSALDLLEDYPVSRPLTVTLSSERTGAVIGTVALEGRMAEDQAPRFTMWVRPNSRVLFSVELPDYRFGLWDQEANPALRQGGKVIIERVSKLPEIPSPAASLSAKATPLSFRGVDGAQRQGALFLPDGEGPFPCLVAHSPSGVVGRYDPARAFAAHGWAVFAYDKRGVGASEGVYDRGALRTLAQDALLAAQALAAHPEIDAERIVFLGLGQGGQVGALALALQAEAGQDRYAGAILGGIVAGKLFPGLVEHAIQQVLVPFYGWDEAQLAAYRQVSVRQWQEWLFAGDEEVSLLRRRASLTALRALNDADLVVSIRQSDVPVLLLHGTADRWAPLEGAQAAANELADTGRVSLQVFEGLDGDLGGQPGANVVASQVEEAIFAWLTAQLGAP